MIFHVPDTKIPELRGVYFEDIDELVSNKDEAWLVNAWLLKYYSTKSAAETFNSRIVTQK